MNQKFTEGRNTGWICTILGMCIALAMSTAALAEPAHEGFETGFITGPEALWPWSTGGHQPWTAVLESPRSGDYCAQAGAIGHNQASYMEISLNVAATSEISFWYRTSTESGGDFLRFKQNGNERGAWSGENDWTQATFAVGRGLHTFRWEFTRNASGDGGSNLVWVDDITFPIGTGISVKTPQGGRDVVQRGGQQDHLGEHRAHRHHGDDRILDRQQGDVARDCHGCAERRRP